MLSFIKLLTAVAFTFICVPAVFAQQPNNAQEKPKEEFVTERQFTSKIFEIKYRQPTSLAHVLGQLGSGFKGSGISPNNEFKTLTVRDFPENVGTIEAAIKRLDTPLPPPSSVELHMHVLLASNRAPSPTSEMPAELKDVITELRGTLTYRNYELVTSVLQRLSETVRGLSGSGMTQLPGSQSETTAAQYEYSISWLSFVPTASGAQSIQIQDFAFTLTGERIRGRVQTSLNFKDGEKVVVGTATLNDRALIVVLIPKIVK